MAEEVVLFAVTGSPFSFRAQMGLKLKRVRYNYIEENVAAKSPELLKYNPVHRKVPVLLHNGKPISESLVILEYIDETWKGGYSILPEDPYEKALARFWGRFIDEKCIPGVFRAFSKKGDEQEKAIEVANKLLKTLEHELEGKKFFGGQNIGFVDIAADFIGYWLGIMQEETGLELVTREKFPRLREWMDDFLDNSIVKECLSPKDYFLTYFRARAGNKDDSRSNTRKNCSHPYPCN